MSRLRDQGVVVRGDELDQAVRSVLARQLSVDENQLTDDTALEPLGLDDRAAAEVLGAVGDELDVRFPDDFFDGVYTYAQLTCAVRLAVGV